MYNALLKAGKKTLELTAILGLLVYGFMPSWMNAAVNNVLMSVPIAEGTVTISSPTSFAFSSIAASFITGTATQDFTGTSNYFIVTDLKGADSGYSSTLQLASDLVTGGNRIASGNVAFKADYAAAVLLSGTANPRVVTDSAATGGYQALNNARTFIYRNAALNTGVLSQYGQHITMQITVPAGQPAGIYSGSIVYTMIEN